MTSSNPFKIFLLLFFVSATLLYSEYRKTQMNKFLETSGNYVLKTLPDIPIKDVEEKTSSQLSSYLDQKGKGLLVHFWGTWCGPCEKELPEFIDMLRELNQKKVKAVLVAINDDEKKVRNYLKKKIGKLPDNIIVSIDNESLALKKFGTMKVPETYAFRGDGALIKKFVGPQDWLSPYFNDYLTEIFSLSKK